MSEKMNGKESAFKHPLAYDVSLLTDDDLYLFNEGSHFRLYDKLGAHPLEHKGAKGTHFAVWAPDAQEVYAYQASESTCDERCSQSLTCQVGFLKQSTAAAAEGGPLCSGVQAAPKIKVFVEGIDTDMCTDRPNQCQYEVKDAYLPG